MYKTWQLTESVGRLHHVAVALHIIIVVSAQTALPIALLSSKGFDRVEKFIVIIFRALSKEASSVWGKHNGINQET